MTVYVDLDDVCADFAGDMAFVSQSKLHDVSAMYKSGFFENLDPVYGAIRAVNAIIDLGYDVQILTQPVFDSPDSYSGKVRWVEMWLPSLINKINMTQDKGLLGRGILIDDNADKWQDKWESADGIFIHYKYGRFSPLRNDRQWKQIVSILKIHKESKENLIEAVRRHNANEEF